MITADANYVIYEGSKVEYTALTCAVDYLFDSVHETFLCTLRPVVISASGTVTVSTNTVLITKASVDAKTGTGTNPSDKLLDQVEQVLIDYLDAITENAGVTFTN